MKKVWLFLAALFVMGQAQAGDASLARNYLEPDEPAFGAYSADVAALLKDAFAPDVRFRVVVEPSFDPEYAVGVRDDGGTPKIFVLKTSVQIWGFQMYQADLHRDVSKYDAEELAGWREGIRHMSKYFPKDAKDITVKRCEIAITPELAAKLTENWSIMVGDIRRPTGNGMGFDGEFYRFSAVVDSKLRRGMVWSPPNNTATGLLVQTAWAMRGWCETKDPNQKTLIDLYTTRLWNLLH